VKPEARAGVSAYVGLGSNLDNPAEQIRSAFRYLEQIAETELVSQSSLYRSAPLGSIEQPDFVNAVAKLSTLLDAQALLAQLQQIERSQGRVYGDRWGPRILDLDLLLYGDHQISSPALTVPHPGIQHRNFVLLPLREIEPDLVIPGVARISDIPVDANNPEISQIV